MKASKLSKSERQAINDFISKLRDRFPREIDSIKLYGSKARGTSHKDSDIDVLVIVSRKSTAIDETVIDLVCDVLNEYGIFIEVITMTSKDYGTAVRYQYPFAINVERDSIQLWTNL